MLKLGYKIWLEKEGKVFGKGPYELLDGIRTYGSLSESAKKINMSYNKAFNLVKEIEKKLGFELIKTKVGGSKGGGSQLTEEAEELMVRYAEFVNECDACLDAIFVRYFNK